MIINGKWMSEPEIIALISQLTAEKEKLERQAVKRGEWKYYKNNGIYDTYKCSICEETFELPMDTDISKAMRYCPNCGADMRGDTE